METYHIVNKVVLCTKAEHDHAEVEKAVEMLENFQRELQLKKYQSKRIRNLYASIESIINVITADNSKLQNLAVMYTDKRTREYKTFRQCKVIKLGEYYRVDRHKWSGIYSAFYNISTQKIELAVTWARWSQ